ncbi:MAG: hypothetical protein S4CHLAM6_12980 [Chlamydiae bacterium]|nr:hypothetical protein [Chlamydiota bacterium]
MASKIRKFTDAYATMTVAVYEPLVLKWVSEWGLREIASINASRAPLSETIDPKHGAIAGKISFGKPKWPDRPQGGQPPPIDPPKPFEAPDLINPGNISPSNSTPSAETPHRAFISPGEHMAITNVANASLTSVLDEQTNRLKASPIMSEPKTVPTVSGHSLNDLAPDFDLKQERNHLFRQYFDNAKRSVDEGLELGHMLQQAKSKAGKPYYGFLPSKGMEESLSPIGIANFYRQLYYYEKEGFGPIEHCFTVAPKESLTVVTTSSRKQIQEELIEFGSETVSERASEERNQYEVSDKVMSMLQRDMSASMSLSASYSTPVFQVSTEATASMNIAKNRSKETASKRLKDVTKRASERITKSYSVQTRSYEEFTEMNETTRVIENTEDKPVNYGLRRIFNRIKVKVQDVGPKLVWQLHIRDPGRGLQTSKFVHFMEASEIIPKKDIPADSPPKPTGGTDTGQTQVAIQFRSGAFYIDLKIKEIKGREIVAVQIDSLKDLSEPDKEDDKTPAPYNNSMTGSWDATKREYNGSLKIRPGNAPNVGVMYTYRWEPDKEALDEWQAATEKVKGEDNAEKRIQEFENKKALLTEHSKVKQRPANELRKEERYEILGRMVSHLFGNSKNPSVPNPKEIEFFHRFFDIDALFVFSHPSWWNPRRKALINRKKYPITAESEPAKLGSSLGWELQLDGDNRRNEFLNSAWVRVCLPLKPNRERQAIEWLAEHVEGKLGFDLEKGPLAELLKSMELHRKNEASLGLGNEDYITVDSTVGAPDTALKPENIYPVVDEFTVTVPTEGFIYDKVEVES